MTRGRPSARVTLAAAVGVLLLTGCQTGADDGPRRAPPLSGLDLQGEPRDIGDLAGEVVVVNVWASWCGPCRDEMPVLQDAQEDLGDDGLQVLGINTRDLPGAAESLVAETGVSFPSVVDTEGTLAVEWGVSGMPQTFVVDRDGTIAAHRFGAVDREWIESTIAPLVHGIPALDETEEAEP
ncbi:TlpA disulfide reductase family protein [Citricoccus nitrophenolicus]|uniref:TlpA disulfide reductase family protein n=1 Tax=Citricoccus nitrophenolicus TaxID=863575 RepID=A0ABV0IJC0_9MICC